MEVMIETYNDLLREAALVVDDLRLSHTWLGTHPPITRLTEHYNFWTQLSLHVRHIERHRGSTRKALMFAQAIIKKVQRVRQQRANNATVNLALHATDMQVYHPLLPSEFFDNRVYEKTVNSEDPEGFYTGKEQLGKFHIEKRGGDTSGGASGGDADPRRPLEKCPFCKKGHPTNVGDYSDCYSLHPLDAPDWWRDLPGSKSKVEAAKKREADAKKKKDG